MRIATRRTMKVMQLVLSIVASAVTIGVPLVGFLLGVVHLPNGYGLLSKPVPVLALLYVAMWLAWVWVAYRLLLVIKRHSGTAPNETNFEIVMYLATVPLSVLWILAWGELLGWPKSGPGSDADFALAFIVFGGIALLFGATISANVATAIDRLLNPVSDLVTPHSTSVPAQYKPPSRQ